MNRVIDLDPNTSRLQMGIKNVKAIPQIEDDIVAADSFERYRHCLFVRCWIIVGNPVFYIDDSRVRHGENFCAIGRPIRRIRGIATKRQPIAPHPTPIGGETLCQVHLTVHDYQGPTMTRAIREPIQCDPPFSSQWRTKHFAGLRCTGTDTSSMHLSCVSNAIRLRGMVLNTSFIAFAVVLSLCSSTTSPVASSTQYQLERSPKSNPIVSFCSEKFLISFAAAVLTFFSAGLLYLLRFERVDTWERTASRRRPAFSSHLIATTIVQE